MKRFPEGFCSAATSGLLGAAAALTGTATGLLAHAADTAAAGPPLLGLAAVFCLARARRFRAGAPPVRPVVDRAFRLGVVFALHPALPLALLPLCRTMPAPAPPALRGADADAARAVRRIVRTATENAWSDPGGPVLLPLLVRRHAEFSARVATATARTARRAAVAGARAQLPVLYALVLTAGVLTLAGPPVLSAVEALVVLLTVGTTPLDGGGDTDG
ncbi:hypothetical protein [Streptomyces erythrochromogenes]|uniref:hypothetical protein n=1 Tax=Streptomyces erythrochromogenes TaxID=285574 RepID=UPI0033EFD93F